MGQSPNTPRGPLDPGLRFVFPEQEREVEVHHAQAFGIMGDAGHGGVEAAPGEGFARRERGEVDRADAEDALDEDAGEGVGKRGMLDDEDARLLARRIG